MDEAYITLGWLFVLAHGPPSIISRFLFRYCRLAALIIYSLLRTFFSIGDGQHELCEFIIPVLWWQGLTMVAFRSIINIP